MMKNENGRSMVEMLGVLAIIGVLSVGGIAGYTMAMNKYKANENLATGSQCIVLAQSDNGGDGILESKTIDCEDDYELPVRAKTELKVTRSGNTYTLHVSGTAVTPAVETAMRNAMPSSGSNKPFELDFS